MTLDYNLFIIICPSCAHQFNLIADNCYQQNIRVVNTLNKTAVDTEIIIQCPSCLKTEHKKQ